MRIVFIETPGLTNDLLRAVAGAAPNCVGYPDGVPESWRDVAPVKQGGDLMPDLPMKHFTDETRGGAGGGASYPDHELDPAALLGPVTEPVDWPDERGDDEC